MNRITAKGMLNGSAMEVEVTIRDHKPIVIVDGVFNQLIHDRFDRLLDL